MSGSRPSSLSAPNAAPSQSHHKKEQPRKNFIVTNYIPRICSVLASEKSSEIALFDIFSHNNSFPPHLVSLSSPYTCLEGGLVHTPVTGGGVGRTPDQDGALRALMGETMPCRERQGQAAISGEAGVKLAQGRAFSQETAQIQGKAETKAKRQLTRRESRANFALGYIVGGVFAFALSAVVATRSGAV